ncbi:type IX secretion system sortase PorU [Epilithonimonas sp. JDS]|uniref:type IX secretion system sortase PorU n=1 Tax=Epilithonimonas sp. JDS TaxID=2902797 RepID=UPI001E508A6D|nr:type IX secretion system sortase PorU [Epilithonimonas sp. JDS]MCD9855031.1 type IX secretion system sortase PorU [Epilithonimonas sp. JDS]
MKFKFYIFVLFIISAFCYAQKITLNWDGYKEMDYGTEKFTYPFFTNQSYRVESGSIFVNTSIKTSNQVKIDQLVWEILSAKDIKDLNINSISTNPKTSVNYYFNESENAESAGVSVEALKVENNKIYKLISFNVEQTSKNVSELRKPATKVGTTENPLKSGNFYKIKVDKSGIFKITKQFLQQNGINVNNINPKNFRIYGNGGLMLPEFNTDSRFAALQEDAIQVIGEEDGVWNDSDYALFYAQGPNGYNLFSRTNGSGNKRTEFRDDKSNNFVNIYEDFSYYFINFDIGPGKRVETVNTSLPADLITRYDDYQFVNEEKFNLMKLGRIWTGDVIPGTKELTFTTRSPIRADDVIRFKTQVIAYNAQSAKVSFDVNGLKEERAPAGTDSYDTMRFEGTLFGQSGNNVKFNYTSNTSANPNASFYFDYAEVQYKEDLNFNNSQMNFRDYEIYEQSGDLYGFSIANASGIDQVWDVSDVTNVKKVTNKNSQNSVFNFGYLANSNIFNNEFAAFKNSAAYEPGFVGKIDNQDYSSLQNVEYLIITQPSYFSQAQRLATYHQSKYKVEIVDVNKIYNEFSSGSKDITAIRDFITKLTTLKYVLLLGDTSYDFKNRIANNTDVIPSYQSENSKDVKSSYVTDDYFVMTKPQTVTDLSQVPDLPIGRIPADNLQEAKIMIDKILAYNNALPGQSNPFGEWRMKLDFVADDDYEGNDIPTGIKGPFHYLVDYAITQNFSTTNRPEYNIRKLYLDAFPAITSAGGQRYPQVNQAISNDVGNSLYLFYFGHGGINGWAQERVLTSTEVQGFNNFTSVYSRFPFVSTITCEFTLWDDPGTYSTGEQLIKVGAGGAATMITSSRAISVVYGRQFTPIFTNNMFALESDDFHSIGDAHLNARKKHYETYQASSDPLRVNFLGDPAMKMSRPKRLLQIDNIETPTPGKIRALDFVKIKGHVKKADGSTDTNFNGRVAINIFDKKIKKTTLNNDNVPEMNPKMTYDEEPSAIVKASGKVESGIYTVEFYVPKDINYDIPVVNGEPVKGRILAYAENFLDAKSNAYDVFTNQPQVVGDINPDGINDSEPPAANLFMNNTNFANGGITDQNPMLLACLKDNFGINSTGAGIGHDLTFVLDGDVVNTTSVNDYFTSGDGNGCNTTGLADYQKGSVTFPLRNLTPGEHQLVFKVWDINNNSTSSTLNFVVKDESEKKLVVNRLLNWPNPFTNKTYVQFEHNCDDILDVNVQIYTITGKIVRTLSTSITAEPFLQGFRTPRQAIEWDGKDDFGDTVAKGTYIFKIFARSQNQEKCSGSATAVEKMVLLK